MLHLSTLIKVLLCSVGFCFCQTALWAQDLTEKERAALVELGQKYLDEVTEQSPPSKIIEHANLAIPLFEKAKNYKKLVAALNTKVAGLYYDGAILSAAKEAKGVMEFAQKYLAQGSIEYIDALNNYAVLCESTDQFEEAKTILETLVNTILSTGEGTDQLALLYSNLGANAKILQDYELAIDYYKKNFSIRLDAFLATGKIEDNLPAAFTDLAGAYKDHKQLELASSLYHRAISLVKESKSKYWTQVALYSYQNLADIHFEKNNRDSTVYYLRQALNVAKKFDLFEDYKTYLIYGKFHMQEGDFVSALEKFKKAQKAAEKEVEGYQRHPEIAHAIAQQGEVYLKMGDCDQAIRTYHQALTINTVDFQEEDVLKNPQLDQFINAPMAIELLGGKANALYRHYMQEEQNLEKLKTAYQSYQLLTQLIQIVRQSYFAQGSKILLSEKILPHFEGAIRVALELYEKEKEVTYLEAAFQFAESNKALILLESMVAEQAKRLSGIPDSLIQIDKHLTNDLAFYQKQYFEEKQKKVDADLEKLKKWETKVFDLKQEARNLSEWLSANYPQYNELKGNFQVTKVRDIQQQVLDKNTALVEYFVGNSELFVFCMTQQGLKVKTAPLSDDFRGQIFTLRNIIAQAPKSHQFKADLHTFQTQSASLFQLLLKETISNLSANIQHLILVPDDVLSYLPFEILLTQAPTNTPSNYYIQELDYLFEDFSLSYSFSATLLANTLQSERVTPSKTFLGFAPTFGSNAISANRDCLSEEINNLQCNQREIETISQMLGGKAHLTTDANVSNFLEDASSYQIIHLSTHACVNDEHPMLNKIFLSDGYLTNYDLQTASINAELAVLSACNTGSGKLLKGEGIMSLARGFTLAGCPSTFTTLWSVDDCATSDFIIQFYENLLEGLPKDVALQHTKVAFLESADAAYAHPYYWAGFVQYGKRAAIRESTQNWWWLGAGGLAVVIITVFLKVKGFF